MNKIICPECGIECNNILAHYKIHDNTVYKKEDFLIKFPDWKGPITNYNIKKFSCVCPECGKPYNRNNGLSIHIKNEHPEVWDKIQKEKQQILLKKPCFICAICSKRSYDLKQHIKIHNVSWKEYCSLYNHNINDSKIISDEYRKHLSDNKKYFYNNTTRGEELKLIQSQKWIEHNVILDPKIKEKFINTRTVNNNLSNNGNYGIHCFYKNINKYTRSYQELKFIIALEYLNIDYIYESGKFSIKYFNDDKQFISTYLPDIKINDTLYEIKCFTEYNNIMQNINDTKYKNIMDVFNKNKIKFEITCFEKYFKKYDINNIILENIIRNKYKNGEITFICSDNSLLVKKITQQNNLFNVQGVILK